MRLRKFLGQAIDIIEVAVGFVFVLLVELSIVESLVVEFGSTMFIFDRIVRGGHRFDCMQVRDCAEVSTFVLSIQMYIKRIPLSSTKIPSTARAS